MEVTQQGPPSASVEDAPDGGPSLSELLETAPASPAIPADSTLGSLPVGARLVLRCRADWRAATVAAYEVELGRVILNVASPKGGTYRVRRPADAALSHDGHVPLLGEGQWRAGLARYDVRW
ncbi:MAG TPA: hypothetical protein VM936_03945 [Pyrinomonadaceae bacterium]|nr:hypothetical protein [Pyrinomonadaceae bacterium]